MPPERQGVRKARSQFTNTSTPARNRPLRPTRRADLEPPAKAEHPREPRGSTRRCASRPSAASSADRAAVVRDRGRMCIRLAQGRGLAVAARIRVVMVHRPAEPAPFPFSSCEVRGTAAIAVFRRFPEMGAPSAISIGMGLTEDRLRLARLPQRPSPTFFRRLRLCIAKQKSRRRPPSTSFQP